MSFKSLLTHWDGETTSKDRLLVAAALARRFDGHLSVASFGCEPDIPPYAFGGATPPMYPDFYGRAKEEAENFAQQADEWLAREGSQGDAMPIVSSYSRIATKFGQLARYADLVVVSQPYGSQHEEAAINLLEGALFDGDAATLVSPLGATDVGNGTIVIGWNGSREALRAVRRAMPFLQQAKAIDIAIIDPYGAEETPGENLALMLARHGLKVEITTLPSSGHSVSEMIRQRILDLDAGLLVIGAYSHSRFREYVIGGVTRDILSDVPIPVFMAH